MDENETLDMIMEISGLLIKGLLPPSLAPYYDHDSDEMLEDKLRVLRALDEGQDFDEIPGAYDILELFPRNDTTWG